MKCYLGIGSNLGDPRKNIERAAEALAPFTTRRSPLFEFRALTPSGSPPEWNKNFLNGVMEIEWKESPLALLRTLKKIETDMGRHGGPRWSPRIIDLDILLFGDLTLESDELTLPHPEMGRRRFVLDPLKHLAPTLTPPGWTETILERSRKLSDPHPLWMGILNLTPDSFSDGGELLGVEGISGSSFLNRLGEFEEALIPIYDLGAESTRPGAATLTPQEEWNRLAPALKILQDGLIPKKYFRPWISIDTRNPVTAARALDWGCDLINDVSALTDPAWLPLLQRSACQYVLMHSLSVPANAEIIMASEEDPVAAIKAWALNKLDLLSQNGISLDRIIFDPGLGFGKTPRQCVSILQRVNEFLELPVRVLIGASRKSLTQVWGGSRPPLERDWMSLGIHLQMAQRGCDILRVHTPVRHREAFIAFEEVRCP